MYQTWGARRWLLIRTLALFLFAVGLLLLAGAGGAIAWVLAGSGAVSWFLPRVVIHRAVRGLPPYALLAREFVLSADAVEVTTALSYSRYAAALVSAQQVDEGGLLLFSGSQVLLFLPREVAQPERFEQACALAVALVENGRVAARAA
ncbi:hypothetical protein ACFQZ4_31685 [Catellatospora coxensis]